MHTKKCLFTGKHNWLIVEIESNNSSSVPFHIYFTIRKNKRMENGLFIFIESAYRKTKGGNIPHRRGRMDRTAFAMLARKTLAGESVRRPAGR
jgi:hypothetical protein